jgi:putative chitobiose transport system permease protein
MFNSKNTNLVDNGSKAMAWFHISPFQKKQLTIYTFLLPFLILFSIFVLIPFVSGIGLSFTDYHIIQRETNFIGLDNYTKLISNDFLFRTTVVNTLYYTAIVVPGTIILGLLFAVYVNKKLWGATFSRIVFFAPYVLSVSVTAMIWGWILEPRFGLLNLYLRLIPGVSDTLIIPWLTSTKLVMPAIALTSVWWQVGFSTVIILAGLQDIPSELTEAAQIDGASEWQIFWRITVPMLRHVLALVTTLSLIVNMRVFGQMFILTQGGPAGKSLSVVYYVYNQAFRRLELGYASGVGVLLLLMILILTLIRSQLLGGEENN